MNDIKNEDKQGETRPAADASHGETGGPAKAL